MADRVWEKVSKRRARVRGRPRRDAVYGDVWRVQDKNKTSIRINEWLAPGNKVKKNKHLEIYRELREDIGIKTHLHGQMDYTRTLKLRFPSGPTRKKKKVHCSSREERMYVAVWHNNRESMTHLV